ncbi:family 78 glycoside hydrolase catalytic domain [Streptomyces justiciae]|uniref:family 78 glycoside hydrolase catalytic domain n=1 Tax=Streptomyces justiciae TaxID=2780140 RepID=UPI00187DDFC1|nr:family 78 glycoside hydrolase catalytic domain [Streptomyces justiciae]MBE8472156.1 family 78 glycoside hydrolase catalytic domain [Streptomyces justiciae]MCW8375962.1 glycoside hydrolase family 78 protein [Streptomyces justiciae]
MSETTHGTPSRRQVVGTMAASAAGLALPLTPGLAAQNAYAQPRDGSGGGTQVVGLAIDGREDHPLGVDDPAPRLSWRVVHADDGWLQSAYQIRAARTERDLDGGRLLWDSGKVRSAAQTDIAWRGPALGSRERVVWRVRVWGEKGGPTPWSRPASWEMGLLRRADWGDARWIEYAGRTVDQPLPVFARAFRVGSRGGEVTKARLYISGVGLQVARLNGRPVTDEVLAPGNSNYQLSVEYRAYDVTDLVRNGDNTLGVELGHGTALVTRSVTNAATGRSAPYSWWQSQFKGTGTLVEAAARGASSIKVSSVANYHVGGTVNIDTGDGGERLESRTITALDTAATTIAFQPALSADHAAGAAVSASGNSLASTDPSAGAAVTPRLIARLELTKADGSVQTVVSDRSWKAALGATTTANWYSGSDYDARREQPGWTAPGADLSAAAERRDGTAMGWVAAGVAPPPNLTTELVWRTAEPLKVVDKLRPVSVTQPQPGVWVFDFGQNFAGWPQLNLDGRVPAGTTVKLQPAESLNADGTVNQASIRGGGASRGTDVFAAYTAHGETPDETWHPQFHYFGMQWLQVTGLPEGYTPTADTVTGLQLHADVPAAGDVRTSDERINRIHRMSRYSVMSNVMSTFTDCPGREKLAYPADYLQPFASLHRIFGYDAYLRTMERHLAEGQSKAGDNIGNVALKAPVYDWGYTGRFGDEINWGDGIVLTPWFLYETYGDTQTMARYYAQMQAFLTYIRTKKAGTGQDAYIVDAALADWISSEQTSGRITGTWGYHQVADRMARMAELLGRTADAAEYRSLATHIKEAFNDAFYNSSLGRYTAQGEQGGTGATQAAQALALDEGLVPESEREKVLDALVELVRAHQPFGGGPHFSGGTIGLAPIVRALHEGGRDDVLWDVLQEDTRPSYGYFMQPTTANPGGLTTHPEQWDMGNSKNHMILLQIEEWFHSGLAGIRQPRGGAGYRELVIDPRPVGDLTRVEGSYRTPYGEVSSEWTRKGGVFRLRVEVPPNTTAEIRVPTGGAKLEDAPDGAKFERVDGDRAVYGVGSGTYVFTARERR